MGDSWQQECFLALLDGSGVAFRTVFGGILALLEAFWAGPGLAWRDLGPPWAASWHSWRRPGALWARSWEHLGGKMWPRKRKIEIQEGVDMKIVRNLENL